MSLDKFRPDEGVAAEIRSRLDAYETQRQTVHRQQRWLIPLSLIPAGLVAILGLMPLLVGGETAMEAGDWMDFAWWLLLGVGMLAYAGVWVAKLPARRLQQSMRDRLLPRLFGFLGDVDYAHGAVPFSFDHLPKEALPDYGNREFGDVLRGRHQWMQFELCELELKTGGKNKRTVFKGLVVSFDMPAAFPGLLLVTPRLGEVAGFFREMFGARLQVVTANDDLLDALYEFRSDHAGAAQPLVRGPLRAALGDLRRASRDGAPRLALTGKLGFLILPTSKDFFELPGVERAALYERDIEPMVADLVALLDTAGTVRQAMAGWDAPPDRDGLLTG